MAEIKREIEVLSWWEHQPRKWRWHDGKNGFIQTKILLGLMFAMFACIALYNKFESGNYGTDDFIIGTWSMLAGIITFIGLLFICGA